MSTYKTVVGSFFLVASKMIVRMLGLVSTLILARLLVPEDFGLVAIAMITLKLFDVLGQTGSKQYIIRKDQVDDDDLNTAWTLDVLFRVTLAIILMALSSLIASIYGDERLGPLLIAISFLSIFSSLTNPGLFLLEREQNYKPLFKLSVSLKILAVITTITLAVIYQNYWALILGQVSTVLFKLIGSYIIHPYRPKKSLVKFHQQFSFSKWMLAKGIVGYSRSQLDTVLVNFNFNASAVGNYHIMKYISSMPSSELITPATQPLLATFSQSKDNPSHLNYQFCISLYILSLISIPLSLFFYEFHRDIVLILLGQQWVDMSEVFGNLSLLIISSAFSGLAINALTAKNKIKHMFVLDLLSLVVMAITLFNLKGILLPEFALARVLVDVAMTLPLLIFVIFFSLKIQLFRIIRLIMSPLLATLLGLYLCQTINFSSAHALVNIIINGALFSVAYIVLILLGNKLLLSGMDEKSYFDKQMLNLINRTGLSKLITLKSDQSKP
ncbi:oligosaccharide flippase family protein [Catenovulum sp. SX2]|uniref:oligosaccharide flippase family protein n=1 Tax=Catenovulum sp. SX2 TaxID=3398614 RepID=UPI003F82E1DE